MKKVVLISLSIFGLLGLLKIYSITPFNRMAADDYSSAVVGRDGLWQALVFTYTHWMGRYSSIFLETIITTHLDPGKTIALYSVVIFTFVYFAFVLFFKRLLHVGYKNIIIYILSLVSFAILYQLSPNKSESWYWLTGSITYLAPIPFFIISLSYIFVKNLVKFDYLLISIIVFLTVGFNETFGFLVAVFYLGLFLIQYFRKIFNKMLFISAASSLPAFLIVLLAPGNKLRMESAGSSPMSFFGSVMYSLKEGPAAFNTILINNLYISLPIFFLLVFVFINYKGTTVEKGMKTDNILKKIYFTLLTGLFFSILYMLPAFKNLGRVQPDRSGITLAAVVLLVFLACAYFLAQIITTEKLEKHSFLKYVFFIATLASLVSSASFTTTLASDVYIARNYSESYEGMIEKLKKAALVGSGEEIAVSLPESGLVAEILDPPGKYTYKNLSLSQYFHIGKVISVPYDYGI